MRNVIENTITASLWGVWGTLLITAGQSLSQSSVEAINLLDSLFSTLEIILPALIFLNALHKISDHSAPELPGDEAQPSKTLVLQKITTSDQFIDIVFKDESLSFSVEKRQTRQDYSENFQASYC